MQPNGDLIGMESVVPISTMAMLKRRKQEATPLQSRGIPLCLPQEPFLVDCGAYPGIPPSYQMSLAQDTLVNVGRQKSERVESWIATD